ncbi:DNA internalization-related competence protein ComEC/Rec2 [Vibrio sp. S4M6]|uniref:DNA internalization-related competence protein ComEC/Rec2 n=1 Tax=Vibrio sinus TaxID=2946865 RepID=UPI00202A44AB|nr:DNA internalization-related competence protein ComEC/Rec2 [Vibrio sinus]MCL9782308.1 DNA internalization-related competence protein ComEC/Rec2 [Vibrio sinus]
MALFCKSWTLLFFVLTILSAPFWPSLPSLEWSAPLVALLILCTKYRRLNWLLGVVLALLVILLKGNQMYAQSHAIFQQGSHVTISAQVGGYFKKINHGYEGTVRLISINGKRLNFFLQSDIRLISPTRINIGEDITAKVKLKHVYGWRNEAGFDRENYYFSQGWLARATVVGDMSVDDRDSTSSAAIKRWLYNKIEEDIATLPHAGLIKALLFGVRDDIAKPIWINLRNSGLSHLLAISGLHIGIAYFIGFACGGVFSRLTRMLIWTPIILGVLFATGYAWLAGFTLSTQRALVMCLFNALLVLLRLHMGAFHRWLATLVVVLILYPFSVLSASFWLSFTAVAILFYVLQLTENDSVVLRAVKIQISLIIFMGPISAMLFQGNSLVSLVYNLVFVPWVSLVVVPAIFFSAVMSALSSPYHSMLWQLCDWLLQPVTYAARYSGFGWFHLSQQQGTLILCAAFFLLSYYLFSRKFLPLLMILLLSNLGFVSSLKAPPDWKVDVLDVGHGLAILIEQKGQTVLYDTGAAWPNGSVAESVIVPILEQRGVSTLDGLILSHQDSDHAGGKETIINELKPRWVRSSAIGKGMLPCDSQHSWRWEELNFDVLWPPTTVSRAYNPHSCVIRISDKENSNSVLLTGDIETVVEWLLSQTGGDALASDILIVPHHGSDSSSTSQFVALVKPSVAIASLAKGNRWKLPNSSVVGRYQDLGATWLDTGENGQISIEIINNIFKISTYRHRQNVTWYRQMLRNGVE